MAGKLAKMAKSQPDSDAVEIWEENWESVSFFLGFCGTQWRVGMGEPTGLDYTAVLASLRTLRLGRDRFDEVFADVRTMESAALAQMAEKK